MAARKRKAKPKRKPVPKKKNNVQKKKQTDNIKNRIKELQTKLEEVTKKPEIREISTSTDDIVEVTAPPKEENFVSPAEYDCIVTALKNPKINNRHKILSLLHNHMVGLEVRFQREIFNLEDNYLKEYYTPLQNLRKVILEANKNNHGDRDMLSEKELVENCKPCFVGDSQKFAELQLRVGRLLSPGYGEPSKKCENFWLIVLLHSDPLLRNLIEPNDVPILRFLSDVRTEPVRLKTARQFPPSTEAECCDAALGYDILFDFLPNPYFSNTTLTKRYLIDVMPDQCDYVTAPHGDVLNGGWSGSNKINIEVLGDECKESMLCQTILNQDHSVDKLLDYNGPQVIAIQGCNIKWYDTGKESYEEFLTQSDDELWEGKMIKSSKRNKPFHSMQNEEEDQTQDLLDLNLSPVAGKPNKNYSFSNLFSSSENSFGLNNDASQSSLFTTFFSGPYFSNRFSRPAGSTESLKSGLSAGTKFSEKSFLPTSTVNPQSSSGVNSQFVVPKVPKKSKSKKDDKKCKLDSSLFDFKSIFQSHLGPFIKESKDLKIKTEDPKEEQFTLANQNPFPRASPYSEGARTFSQISGFSQWSQPEKNSKDFEVFPAVRGGAEDFSPKDSQKSFFNFFEVNWNEKSPDHCKEISRDYQIGAYIRDILIPRAYMFYRQKDLTDQDRECHDHQVIASIGNRYDKEFKAPPDLETSTNYDEIDDEIPLAISKQALKTIQASESVKMEILESNKDTASRLANSFIGKILRQNDASLRNISGDDLTLPSKKCHSSIFGKKLVNDDMAVTSSQSYTTESGNLLHRIQSKFSAKSKKQITKRIQPSTSNEFFEEAPPLESSFPEQTKQYNSNIVEGTDDSLLHDITNDEVGNLNWSAPMTPDIDEEIDMFKLQASQDAEMPDVQSPFDSPAPLNIDSKTNEAEEMNPNTPTNVFQEFQETHETKKPELTLFLDDKITMNKPSNNMLKIDDIIMKETSKDESKPNDEATDSDLFSTIRP